MINCSKFIFSDKIYFIFTETRTNYTKIINLISKRKTKLQNTETNKQTTRTNRFRNKTDDQLSTIFLSSEFPTSGSATEPPHYVSSTDVHDWLIIPKTHIDRRRTLRPRGDEGGGLRGPVKYWAPVRGRGRIPLGGAPVSFVAEVESFEG